MQSNYERLGKYINVVDKRNRNLQNENLIGLSIQKKFISSISNTIGTDMSTYRIIKTNQFAYCPVTSRNGEKVTIALYQVNDTAIISQAYDVFEINDEERLLPEYLMMWFCRPEFDRYARFISHGSVRELFGWEELCDVQLPVPAIEKQIEIIKEYSTIVNRITLNNQLIQKLEETAQAIYKQWLVDFEFPDENGKPYKSNGGEMEFNKELEREIPKGWKGEILDNYVKLSQGIQVDVELQSTEPFRKCKRFIRIIDYTPNTEEMPRYIEDMGNQYYCSDDDIAMVRYGDIGLVGRRLEGIIANNLFKISPTKLLTNNFLYYFLNQTEVQNTIKSSSASSALPAITHTAIKQIQIIVPNEYLINQFDKIAKSFESIILTKTKETFNLKILLGLVLSKISRS